MSLLLGRLATAAHLPSAVIACILLTCLHLPAKATDVAWVWFSSDAPTAVQEVSVLTESIHFIGEHIEIRHRMRALEIEPGTKVTPTVHVHQDSARPLHLSARHAAVIESTLVAASRRSTSQWVQLDFEAFDEQQDFYVDLVKTLRKRLPAALKLSVTVRAGWCDKPALLASLAADEVVPMFFRMGKAADGYRERLTAKPESLAPRCREQAIGLARQEPLPADVSARYQRRYWFNYRNWTNSEGG